MKSTIKLMALTVCITSCTTQHASTNLDASSGKPKEFPTYVLDYYLSTEANDGITTAKLTIPAMGGSHAIMLVDLGTCQKAGRNPLDEYCTNGMFSAALAIPGGVHTNYQAMLDLASNPPQHFSFTCNVVDNAQDGPDESGLHVRCDQPQRISTISSR